MVSGVHPSWEVERLRPEGFEPSVGGMAFLEDGRLLLSTFTPNNNGVLRQATNGTLWILDGAVGGTWSDVTVEKIADDFHDPCGVVVVDGEIFVSHREGIDRLWDENGDGTYESREVFAQPWVGTTTITSPSAWWNMKAGSTEPFRPRFTSTTPSKPTGLKDRWSQ